MGKNQRLEKSKPAQNTCLGIVPKMAGIHCVITYLTAKKNILKWYNMISYSINFDKILENSSQNKFWKLWRH